MNEQTNTRIAEISEEKEKEEKIIFREIMTENLPNLVKNIHLQI